MAKQTCVHCGQVKVVGTKTTQVEWNPIEEHWQCRDVARCARVAAEAKLGDRLRREMGL